MNVKRKTIGRTFNQSSHLSDSEQSENQFKQTFTLSSGRKVVFVLKSIPAEKIVDETFVNQETNGRDQLSLTSESLKDITRTISLQQFFPAIGVQNNEKIEILDGSRRRAAAILCQAPLNVLVTQTHISVEDARQLANDIQTAKEHNIREIGLQLLKLKESGLSQKEIAETRSLSQAKVTRALQAANVPSEYISLFPVPSELSYNDYKALLSVHGLLIEHGLDYIDLILELEDQIAALNANDGIQADELKTKIMQLIRVRATDLAKLPKREMAITTTLWTFPDKDRFARKKNKGRAFSYEFNRLPKDLQDELDSVIDDVLSKYLSINSD